MPGRCPGVWWLRRASKTLPAFYGRSVTPRHVGPPSVAEAKEKLHAALCRALNYLTANELCAWQLRFAEALARLDGDPRPIPYHQDLLAVPDLEEQQLAAAVLHVWVFASDPFTEHVAQADRRRSVVWPQLTHLIRDALYGAIIAAANARTGARSLRIHGHE